VGTEKMKRLSFLLCTIFVSVASIQAAQTTFSFFVKPYPGSAPLTKSKVLDFLDSPTKVVSHAVINAKARKYLPALDLNIFYQGMAATTDRNGLVSLPIKQEKTEFVWIATPEIVPVVSAKRQVNHMEWADDSDTGLFDVKRNHDKQTDLFFWNVKAKKLPDKQRIPHNGIVLCAKAKHLFVPEGITLTWGGSEWILPSIYVKKSFNSSVPTLNAMRVRRFFAHESQELKKVKKGYQGLVRRYGGH
jgi:hypothetical protein